MPAAERTATTHNGHLGVSAVTTTAPIDSIAPATRRTPRAGSLLRHIIAVAQA
jgi:hypothetical protein